MPCVGCFSKFLKLNQHMFILMRKREWIKTLLKSYGCASGSPATLDANIVLIVVGKTPFTRGLGLQELGVKVDNYGRVEVGHHLFPILRPMSMVLMPSVMSFPDMCLHTKQRRMV